MKNITKNKNGSLLERSSYRLLLSIIFLSGILTTAQAQAPVSPATPEYARPSWWFGAAAGANFNFYRGTTQQFNEDLTVPSAFHHGKGAGLYLAPLVEFYRPESRWGLMFQAGYDSRKGSFDQINTSCNCPADLSTDLSYVTFEPSLRFAPFKSNFYLYAGPRLAFNVAKSFTYKLGINPAFPNQEANPEVKGDFSDVNNILLSMQIGAGYDIPLSSQAKQTQWVVSPFVSFQPYYGQDPRSSETWSLTTLRVGAAIKFGRGNKATAADDSDPKSANATDLSENAKDADVQFAIYSPENIPVERRVRETFPLRNYVFFDIGSTEIADRYVLLQKDQVRDFKETQLEVFTPKKLSGRSDREMIVYYNILNILGDRLGKNPSTKVTLVGSSEKGSEEGKKMATSIKDYLVGVFGIDGSRINIEGRDKPKLPSKQVGGTEELDLLREGDHRVSIESSSPSLIMEFQSGPDAPLKPVEIVAVQQAPLDSYVTFKVTDEKDILTSWSLEIMDEKGTIQNFGPYTQEKLALPGKSILGTRSEGDFNIKMVGKTNDGKDVQKNASAHMRLWTPGENEEGMRYSVLFEFDDPKAIKIYEKYLTEIVANKIPKNGTVIISGYTDIIGNKAHNEALATERAENVRIIIEKALVKKGRKDVKFEVYGFGEDEKLSPFKNTYPEERFYNRTVIIDIIPAK